MERLVEGGGERERRWRRTIVRLFPPLCSTISSRYPEIFEPVFFKGAPLIGEEDRVNRYSKRNERGERERSLSLSKEISRSWPLTMGSMINVRWRNDVGRGVVSRVTVSNQLDSNHESIINACKLYGGGCGIGAATDSMDRLGGNRSVEENAEQWVLIATVRKVATPHSVPGHHFRSGRSFFLPVDTFNARLNFSTNIDRQRRKNRGYISL